jgi:hypothetical protein
MKYRDQAINVVYGWETNYKKSLTDVDREGLVSMIAYALRKAAYFAQKPQAEPVIHPDA